MKKIRLLTVLSLIICCLAVFSSCNRLESLQTPTDIKVDPATLTLSWDEVKDARLYTVSITPVGGETKEVSSSKTMYSLTSLDAGDYLIKVKAVGKDEVNKDSDWSEQIQFTREQEPGMVFTLINNNTEYEVKDKGVATGDIVIPDTYRGKPVTSIGKKAFFNKSDVATVTLGKNIRSIGDFAFANCSYITSINLPEGLTYIGESAFASCRLLAGDLVIPEGVTAIPNKAFAYCGQLTGVKLGSGVKTVGANAFTDCRGLLSIEMPDSVVFIDQYAFAMCESVKTVKLGAGIETVAAFAFSGNKAVQSIVIPDSVKYIGEGAFLNCSALSSVTLGSGVETFSFGAFQNTALWNDSVTNEVYVGKWFLGLKDNSASYVNLKDDTYGIASLALYGYKGMYDIILPNSVKVIGGAAFGESGFINVVIGSGVEVIGEQAFVACTGLVNVILGSYDNETSTITGSSLKTIGDYAFRECSALEKISIPETVTSIGSYAFRDSGIYKASEDGIVYADTWVVDYTEALQGDISIPRGTVGVANYAFYNCTALTGIELPNTVEIIGRAAFYKCSQLVAVTLPNTLEVIDDYTFYYCSRLELFDLPPYA